MDNERLLRYRFKIGLTAFLVILFGYAALKATVSFSRGAAIFPVLVGVPGGILCVIQLAKEIRAASKCQEDQTMDIGEVGSEETVPFSVAFRKAGTMLLWILGLYVAMGIVGFKIAVTAFFVIYLRRVARVRWLTTLVLTGIAVYVIFFHFVYLLNVYWPSCLLSKWLDVPWLWR